MLNNKHLNIVDYTKKNTNLDHIHKYLRNREEKTNSSQTAFIDTACL